MAKIVVANWKMNPSSLEEANKLAKESDIDGLIICPSFPFLKIAEDVIKKSKLGAQDLFWKGEGAYTGEVSGIQLKDVGVEYVIIGHSERRQNLRETDEMIAKKIAAAVKAGLTPILCVGEDLLIRKQGKKAVEDFIKKQLQTDLKDLPLNSRFIVAYEPIWAIGTGTPDTPGNMIEMSKFIKSRMTGVGCRVIYGGSVNSKNVKDFLKHKEIEGVLVGGASLDAKEIKKIVEIAKKYD